MLKERAANIRTLSEHFGMPGAAIRTKAVDFVLPLEAIASTLVGLVNTGVGG